MNQHQALANLHKVVQICNSGLNYDQIKQSMKGKKLNLNSNASIQHKYKTIQSHSSNQLSQGLVGVPALPGPGDNSQSDSFNRGGNQSGQVTNRKKVIPQNLNTISGPHLNDDQQLAIEAGNTNYDDGSAQQMQHYGQQPTVSGQHQQNEQRSNGGFLITAIDQDQQ